MTTVYITARRLSGGKKHRHITEVEWENRDTGETDIWAREKMVSWVRTPGNKALVDDPFPPGYVMVGVVDKKPPFLRTYRDNTKTDNLLELPDIKN
jgi:hypothetical protein